MLNCLACNSNLESDSTTVLTGVTSVYSRSQDAATYDLVECKCGLLQTSPRVVGEKLSKIYEENYAYDFHELVSSEKSKRATGLSRIIGKPSDSGKLFEFGCAQGELLNAFIKSGWKVSGCEIGQNSQRICEEKGLQVSLSTAEESLTRLEPDIELFVLSHVLEHLEDPRNFLTNLAGKAASNSKLMLVVPNVDSVKRTRVAKYWGYWQVPVHITHFNKSSLTKLAEVSGWDIASIHYRSRDFMGFALTFANLIGYVSSNSSPGVASHLIKWISRLWSYGYRFGRSDLILILNPKSSI